MSGFRAPLTILSLTTALLPGCATLSHWAEDANKRPGTAAWVASEYGSGGAHFSSQPAALLDEFGPEDYRLRQEGEWGATLTLEWNCADGEFRRMVWEEKTADGALYYQILETTTATGDCP